MKHAELIARLEAAEVGSRELDASICVLLQYGGPNSDGATNVRTDGDWEGDLLFEQGSDECCNPIPAVTTSLDCSLALAERVLPGCYVGFQMNRGVGECWLWSAWITHDNGDTEMDAHTAPLALCIAILRALNAQEQKC